MVSRVSCREADGVAVPRNFGELALKTLKRSNLYLQELKVTHRDDTIVIPVTNVEKAIAILRSQHIPCRHLRMCFPSKTTLRHATLRDFLRDKVPQKDLERIPRSFYIVGDIALISLDIELAERYGHLIAEAIMKLHPRIRAVYARGETVGIERVRRLIFLGGEPHTRTIHRESGINIVVDIAHAYYNPALATEHERVASIIATTPGAKILDAFTGVGPFALHIAKRSWCYVVACDINIYALKLLRESIRLNKLRGHIEALNVDSFKLLESLDRAGILFDYIIMNMPHQAIEALCHALNAVRSRGLIFVYTIAHSDDEALSQVKNKTLECRGIAFRVVEVRRVLDYAPRKYIYRLTLERT
ncbi:MAG TPA: class I SAM-dependent methyltransferase family protein [Ignisphaera aggregans]|uniref:Class I SAM-dependent methyltransferase family protein n=1 Tax=Ignisphaera aggregans TaxID=334771 RepID=A0A833DUC8_9CREN|nr:class I SAM-dependent methyltransferase family protein [Ignisphaera aggregans]